MESFNFAGINVRKNEIWPAKKSIGSISRKVLTANLRSMEDSGFVNRKVYAVVPPRVEYALTETGYSLKSILDAMAAWGEDYR